MAQQSFLDKVREWIGGLAWSIFLWSARTTEDEYFAELDSRSPTLRAPVQSEQNGACHELHNQWMLLYNFCPECGADVRPVQTRSDGG